MTTASSLDRTPGAPEPDAASDLQRLLAHPAQFDFTQAVGILQAGTPGSVPVGFLGPPQREAVRLRPTLDLAFASADIAALEELPAGGLVDVLTGPNAGRGPRYRLETCFLGLYGPASPLPTYFTENLLSQDESGAVRDFIDLFHHRLLSLAYRVMTKYRLGENPGYQPRLLALIGQVDGLTGGQRLDPRSMLACAGLLSQQPRSANALERVLSFWLEAPVAIEQCVARWIDLPRERQARLGTEFRLGIDTVAGERIFDRATSFRVVIGPVGSSAFQGLLPHGPAHAAVRELIAEFNTECLDFDFEILVKAGDCPPPRLDGQSRLGLDTCLAGDPDLLLHVRSTPV